MLIVLVTLTWAVVRLVICFLGLSSFPCCELLCSDPRFHSDFIPTCSECSTAHPAPGVPAVRGESAMAICRQCHRKMGMFPIHRVFFSATNMTVVFKIPEVKFLLVGSAASKSRHNKLARDAFTHCCIVNTRGALPLKRKVRSFYHIS